MTLTAAEWLLLGVGLGYLSAIVTMLAWAVWGVRRNGRAARRR